jgi:homoserine dehydrogenase
MYENPEWALIGPGNIGSELRRQLDQEHVAQRLGLNRIPKFVIRSAGITRPDGEIAQGIHSLDDIDNLPGVTFIALPSTDDGKIAYDYISPILARGKIAVTAEKGAISNYFSELREESADFTRLGVNATVGGGTRMLEVAKQYADDRDNITQIHLALNGTMSAIMSLIAPPGGSGMSLGQAAHQAIKLGYAEPGPASPYDVVRLEAESDIPKKTSIFFNKVELGDLLGWEKLKFELTDEQIARAVDEASIRRFIVSLYSEQYIEKTVNCPEDDIIGGFNVEHSGWRIVGGFRHVERNPLFSSLARITGPGNGLAIGLGPDETDGVYSLTGPGAGVEPTVNAMIDDYIAKTKS